MHTHNKAKIIITLTKKKHKSNSYTGSGVAAYIGLNGKTFLNAIRINQKHKITHNNKSKLTLLRTAVVRLYGYTLVSVSYTHLTLPTNREV